MNARSAWTLAPTLALPISLWLACHGYIWARLVRDAHWAPRTQWWVQSGLGMLALGVPVAIALSRTGAGAAQSLARRSSLGVAYLWMGTMFIIVCMLAATDVGRWLWQLGQRALGGPSWQPASPARRQALARLLSGGVSVGAAVGAATAVYTARRRLQVRHQPIRIAMWPRGLHGFRIAQISDLHLAPLLGEAYVREVVQRTLQLGADIIVVTGDLMDGSVEALWPQARHLAQLKAPLGVFFVTGNHEYYSGVEPWLEALRSLGMVVLRNERVHIGADRGGFDLVGIDDLAGRRMAPGHGPNLDAAMAGRVDGRPTILLAHQPRMIEEAAKHRIDLMLSGHTHGGQIWPFGYLVRLQQPYVAGWAQHGPTQIYVNRGTGYWGPPMRLGARPELTLLSIDSA